MANTSPKSIVLRQATESTFMRKDADFPSRDGSLAFEIRGTDRGWHFDVTEAKDCGIGGIYRFDLDGEARPSSIPRHIVLSVIGQRMETVKDTDEGRARQAMVKVGAAHPLSGGLSIEADGKISSLCDAFSAAEIDAQASEVLDVRAEQAIFMAAEVLSHNTDRNTRFLVIDDEADKAKFARRHDVSLRDDMDLIVEVDVSRDSVRRQVTFLHPVGVFQMSKEPRFDYTSRVLSGVSQYQDLCGGRNYHADIYNAQAIMHRLPSGDIQQEDCRSRIDDALYDIGRDTPEPG